MKTNELIDLYTPEGKTLGDSVWEVYPRPQLKRDSFFCLNGRWDFGTSESDEAPRELDMKILVPFCPECLLSGVHKRFSEKTRLFYKRRFVLPEGFVRERVILHFGAVDQVATVWLNGELLGTHEGGYEPFSFDVTEILRGDNEILVRVRDELSSFVLPYGKQCQKRGGMWYTPVSGIWQTVWLESVVREHVNSLKINTGEDFVEILADGVSEGSVKVDTPDGEISVALEGGRARVNLDNPRPWSPEDPYLYRFVLDTEGGDRVESYFALRTLEIKDFDGIKRLCLNGKPYFFHGLLDQGYFSDGLFTPATPEGYERDILAMKKLGFNVLRKHIKIEPEQFYYDCDRLGMIVFQDMVNNGSYSFVRDTALPTIGMKRFPDRILHRNKKTRAAFYSHMESTVRRLYNHPSICYWTIFNEGWGQFNSTKAYERLREIDSTRFIDSASGWFGGGESDIESLHIYFKPVKIKSSDKPIVLSEFGGYSYKPRGHVSNVSSTYGYGKFEDRDEFVAALRKLYLDEVLPLLERGLCGAIYTQVSDVEDETNGLISYDRCVTKVESSEFADISKKLREIL